MKSPSSHQNTSCTEAAKPAHTCLIVLPFYSSPPFDTLIKQSSNATSQAFANVQRSIASAAHKWFSQIHILASTNPILHNLLSFPSHFQQLSQVSFRPRTSSDNLSHHSFAAILPGDSVAGLVAANGILNFLNIYNTLLIARLVLTWFPNAPPVIVSPLSTLCDPYLNIFRGIIPPLGGTLDLSPILAFLVLNAFTSTASALPAELPSGGEHADGSLQTPGTPTTATQKKWMKRLAANQKISSEK